ncbi:hypothetical protein ZHAS_00013959 [Anopheles sinensis]|uniref:Uncharacterized protein n=1 Tax=Anopheles sinensis TaxID=74873 RepID=A0A084W6Z9_ANOSI|nr:hypothetical protein ZHAS_00013959 [Anopheles sinensis]
MSKNSRRTVAVSEISLFVYVLVCVRRFSIIGIWSIGISINELAGGSTTLGREEHVKLAGKRRVLQRTDGSTIDG